MADPVFKKVFVVTDDAIDVNGHVNNLVYLQWFLEAATEHAETAGWGQKAYEELGAMWVVKRHTIEYLHPAYEGDRLILTTWIDAVDKIKSVRKYRLEKENGTCICEGETIWVFVDSKTLRPRRIPDDMAKRFKSEQ